MRVGGRVIHYHGLDINPATAALTAINGGHAFVSFAYPKQLPIVLEVAQSFAIDNGAFSFWRNGGTPPDWKRYHEWVAWLGRFPAFDFAVIPDVIDGTEKENDRLIDEWPWWVPKHRHYGAPVWHLHESIERLERLAGNWPRVCLGSSGEFHQIGSSRWWSRMAEAFNAVCDRDGRPICKIHGLRMLDPQIFTRFPFASADSTNIGRNIGIDSKWNGGYQPPDKPWRAAVMRSRIEQYQSPQLWNRQATQEHLDLFSTTFASPAGADGMPLPPTG